jgi:hypothetical protein
MSSNSGQEGAAVPAAAKSSWGPFLKVGFLMASLFSRFFKRIEEADAEGCEGCSRLRASMEIWRA